jgi:pyrroloquinoline quinone biosynthesis protein D
MAEIANEDIVPRLGLGIKFRFDSVRQAWVLLGPERLFLPDEQAVEILKLVDGQRSLKQLIDELASQFDAPREMIATDVGAMLVDLAGKGALRW